MRHDVPATMRVVADDRTAMNEDSARRVANGILGVAAAGAVCYIVATPRLRRLAWRLTLVALAGPIPAWVRREVTNAWAASRDSQLARTSRLAPRDSRGGQWAVAEERTVTSDLRFANDEDQIRRI